MKVIQIKNKEWWFYGCFIQFQRHPILRPYRVFKDTEQQEEVGTYHNFKEAKAACISNKVDDYFIGYKKFL